MVNVVVFAGEMDNPHFYCIQGVPVILRPSDVVPGAPITKISKTIRDVRSPSSINNVAVSVIIIHYMVQLACDLKSLLLELIR